jgi:hypothetical protein
MKDLARFWSRSHSIVALTGAAFCVSFLVWSIGQDQRTERATRTRIMAALQSAIAGPSLFGDGQEVEQRLRGFASVPNVRGIVVRGNGGTFRAAYPPATAPRVVCTAGWQELRVGAQKVGEVCVEFESSPGPLRSLGSTMPLLLLVLSVLLGMTIAFRLDPLVLPRGSRRAVFLSYRFDEAPLVKLLRDKLTGAGYLVLTGELAPNSISRDIVARVRQCESLISVLTHVAPLADGGFTTGSWLLEEKGVAAALGRRNLVLCEHDVIYPGAIQGDAQYIVFRREAFVEACDRVISLLGATRA